jgi:hypothetical protein
MDALALPVLGVLIVIFLIYIWAAWLSDKNDLALRIRDEDEDDERDAQGSEDYR